MITESAGGGGQARSCRAWLRRLCPGAGRPVAAFRTDRRGVAALEMALIAPVLLICLLGLIETVDVLMVERKVSTLTSTMADLVSRVDQIDDQGVADVYAASRAVLQPYPNSGLRVRITSIERNSGSTIKVHWSDGSGLSPYTKGASFPGTLPAGILGPNETVVLAQLEYDYAGPVTDLIFNGYTITNEYFAKPRKSRSVLRCDDLGDDSPDCF